MEDNRLFAEKRTVLGRHVGQLRRSGQLPGVLYGRGIDPIPLQLNTRAASRILRRVRGAHLLDLTVDGKVHKVLVQDLQRDAIRGDFLHVDFYAVDMTRKVRVNVPVHLVGTSFAVASLSGVLVHGTTEIEVECLPTDLVSGVDADLGELKEIGAAIYVRDLYLPSSITVLTDPEEVVARVTFQAQEEDLEAPVTTLSAEVEVIEKGKAEEEGEEAEASEA